MNQHPDTALPVPFADTVDRLLIRLSQAVAWIFAILMVVILTQVMLRRGFSAGMIALEELQWHLYAIGVFAGVVYAQANNSHVRVDVLHGQFGPTAKHLVEILGLTLLLLPFLSLVFYHGLDFVYQSWRINERSIAPAGLPWRWLIKTLIPVTMGLMIIAALNRLFREAILLQRHLSGGHHDGN